MELAIESATEELARLVTALRTETLLRALALMNSRARYRFTGLYRVDGRMLRNVALFDRERPGVDARGDSAPLSDSYCSIVTATSRSFVTYDARSDERLASHAARRTVVSYAGVSVAAPLVSGTLCHFDGRPRLIPNGELEFLESIAQAFAPFLGSGVRTFTQ